MIGVGGQRDSNDCLIGAGSLVNKNIPDNSTAYGNPIKIKQK